MRASAAGARAYEAVRTALEKSGLRLDSQLHKLGYEGGVASKTSVSLDDLRQVTPEQVPTPLMRRLSEGEE